MSIEIPGLPALAWTGAPGRAAYADGVLELTASARTDWTNDAGGGPSQQGATALGFAAPAEFMLSARVTVTSPRTTYDAGALAIWADADHWAKVCFEFSPQGEAMVVSVVTNDFSDDVNSTLVAAPSVHLRITRTGPAWAFHSSNDGVRWDFVRVFRLATHAPVTVGFLAQAPLGERCDASFDQIEFGTTAPRDLRDGS